MRRARSIGNEKRMRRHNIAALAVALVIIATQVPDVYAQGDNAPAPAASPATQAPSAPNSAASPDKAAPASSAEPTSVAIAELPQDLSSWGMFMHADRIVQAVMIGLAIASVMTWTVWIAKSLELRSARGRPQGRTRPWQMLHAGAGQRSARRRHRPRRATLASGDK